MKKFGRPVLPKKEKRNRILQIRLTDDEYKKISKEAHKDNKQVSNWARKALLDLTDT